MFRRALTMAAVFGLILAGAVRAGTGQAGDRAGRDAARRDLADEDSRPIPPKSSDAAAKAGKTVRTATRAKTSAGGWWTTLGGLLAVLAMVFLTAKIVKRSVPAAQKTLPPEVVQVLGRKALDYRHTVHLVRFGSRLLMIGISQEGMTTLSEITDQVEIDYLAGLCKPSEAASVAHSFNQLFQRFQTTEPPRAVSAPSTKEGAPALDLEADRDAEPDADPAILRLQERLQQSTRPALAPRMDLASGSVPESTEAQG
jgi:flagellar biogenesis protein FliO